MKKTFLSILISSCAIIQGMAQPLFTIGKSTVSKEEFMRSYNKNMSYADNKEASLREYLDLYARFKLKVAAASEMKLDTLKEMKYDIQNFRNRLANEYMIADAELLAKIGFKKNNKISEEELFLYADSAAYSKQKRTWPHAGEPLFFTGNTAVKGSAWYQYAKEQKLNNNNIKNNKELFENFIKEAATSWYRNHLEEYNEEFKFRLQEFKEGNLLYQVMEMKIWNRSENMNDDLKAFYETNKQLFVWQESADVVVINARSVAYADYALENIRKGKAWQQIADNSEGMIMGDSSRYELSQLPLKTGTKLSEGMITDVYRYPGNENAGFVKIIKLYPAGEQRNFEEARSMVLNEYRKQLEENWIGELAKRYPLKINNSVLRTLLQ